MITERRSQLLAFWGVVSVALLLRFILITDQSLWHDEGVALLLSDGGFSENLARLLTVESGDRYQPLYYLLLGLWRSAFGDSTFALRALSAFLGTTAVALAYKTAQDLFERRWALWTAVIGAVSAFGVFYSQEVRPYSLVMVLAASEIFLLERVLYGKGRLLHRIGLALCTLLCLLSSVMMLVFVFSLAVGHYLFRNRLGSASTWFSAWWPSVITSAPVLLFFATSTGLRSPEVVSVTRSGASIVQNALYVPYGVAAGTTFGPPQIELRGSTAQRIEVVADHWPAIVLLGLVGIGLFAIVLFRLLGPGPENASNRGAKVGLLLATLLLAFAGSMAFAMYTGLNWLPRHSAFLAIPLWLIVPYSTQIASREIGSRMRRASGTILVALLLGINLASLRSYFFDPSFARDDFRSVATVISANHAPGESVFILRGTPRLLEYYGVPTATRIDDEVDELEVVRTIRSEAEEATGFWLVIYRPFEGPFRDQLEAGLGDRWNVEETQFFNYFELIRFAPN